MTIHFTADTHFSHRRIPVYTKRRFCLSEDELRLLDSGAPVQRRDTPYGWIPSDESLRRHDDYVLKQINAVVEPGDTLYHIGDYCFGPRGRVRQHASWLRDQINCKTIYLIWGNHDRYEISSVFTKTYTEYTGRIQGQKVYLHHAAKAVWYGSHDGGWNLYGHSHGTAEDYLDKILPNRRSIDVGIDNAFRVLGEYRPFSFNELLDILNSRSGISIDVGQEA